MRNIALIILPLFCRCSAAVLPLLEIETGVTAESQIAEIGSGTGLFTRIFVENGNPVYAVEPNAEMRACAEAQFSASSNFHSVAAKADATGLKDGMFDLVAMAQSFHWFNNSVAAAELNRIKKTDGHFVFVWNRHLECPLQHDWEKIIARYNLYKNENLMKKYRDSDYGTIIREQFGRYRFFELDDVHSLDRTGLAGRIESSSYMPNTDDNTYRFLLSDINELFDRHNKKGLVHVNMKTKVFIV